MARSPTPLLPRPRLARPSSRRASARARGLARAWALVGLALAPGLGCKSAEGQVCRCASDCRDGLICVVDDSEVLGPGECTVNLEIGYCTPDESLPDEGGGLGDMPIFDDMPSKRDLPSGDEGGSETGTGDGDGDPTTTGDGDGDPTTGDGDGDLTTGDGDGDLTTGDGDGDLTTTGDGDGDLTTTGDGDGDLTTTGDGDGDPMP